jgi:hypothetical protein
LTSETPVSGTTGSIHFEVGRESKAGNGTPLDVYTTGSVDTYKETPGELGVGTEIRIDLHPNKQIQ